MASSRQDRLKAYIDLISRHDDEIESINESLLALENASFSEDPQVLAANVAMAKLKGRGDSDLSLDEMASLEAIILPRARPAIDIIDGNFTSTHSLWRHLNDDPEINAMLRAAIPAVGRVELPGQSRIPYGGSGLLVGPGLVMTNRHVAELFAFGPGKRNLEFRPGWQAGFDCKAERDRPAGMTFPVNRVHMIHPYWDMALLELEGLTSIKPLKLSLLDTNDLDGRQVAVIGYPAYDPQRNDIDTQVRLFDGVFGVKRLQPGRLGPRKQTESYAKLVSAVTHDCSTLGGNSGSAILDLATGEVLALHFAGRYLESNYAVPALELSRDGRVVDAGVSFAGSATGGIPAWQDWWTRLEKAAVAGRTDTTPSNTSANAVQPSQTASQSSSSDDNSCTITVPINITIRLGQPGHVTTTTDTQSDSKARTEGLVVPIIDTEYSTRTGYADDFLEGIFVPPPSAANPGVLARTKSGGSRLDYQNFSIWMHAERRLSLITAANVTAEPALKEPEPGRDYTRKGLTGLGENDQEKWLEDPRLDSTFQLPDVFFTKDKGAFDKGHIVRRDDVAWGSSYEIVRRANGDSYHVTNCSPQVSGFNQSGKGSDNWGDLENMVLSQAASERLCVFAGPILDSGDDFFVGAAGRGQLLRARIPQAFWKVIVARTHSGIAAYGFLLEQDLSLVALEFTVADNFIKTMVPLAEIETRAGLVFDSAIRAVDQCAVGGGDELVFRAGIKRR